MEKILLFTDSLGAGGAQRQLVGLAKLLKKDGIQVKVVTYHDIPFYLPTLIENNIEYENVSKAHIAWKRFFLIYRMFRREKPNWVIAYLDTPCILACLCKLLGRNFKLLVSERNTTQRLTLKERFKFLLYRVADKIVPNSYSQERFILENNWGSQEKVKVITNFVDTHYFQNQQTKYRKSVPVIVVVATIWQSKNTLGFIDAIKLLRDAGMQFIVYWYGKSNASLDYFEECQRKIADYQLEDYIVLKEKTTQIKEVYLDADYFCLPSFYEGTPNALCEAISCGLPVICSNVCDNSLYVQDGKNGYLFDPHSIQDMKEKLLQMLEINDELYVKFSKESRRIAEENLSIDRFFTEYKELLNL